MESLLKEFENALSEAKAERKKCWRDDIEEKAYYDGEVSAYQYVVGTIKRYMNENPVINP